MPPSQVLRAIRRLGGFGLELSLQRAVRIVTDAFERRVEMPRSAILDLGSLALDATVVLDLRTRINAAKAVSPFGERGTVKRAVHAIGVNEAPLDVLQAAAVILLGPPVRRLSRKTVLSLQQRLKRYGQIRGPIIDLVLLTARSGALPSNWKR